MFERKLFILSIVFFTLILYLLYRLTIVFTILEGWLEINGSISPTSAANSQKAKNNINTAIWVIRMICFFLFTLLKTHGVPGICPACFCQT